MTQPPSPSPSSQDRRRAPPTRCRRRWRCTARASTSSPCSATWRSCRRTRTTSTRSITSRCWRIQEGQIAEGLKVIDRALAVGPPQARLYNLLGQAHLRQNQDDDALQGLRPRDRDRPGVRRRLRQPRHAARRDEALPGGARRLRTARDAAARTTPTDLCNRAGVLLDLGRLDEALTGFDRALALMPTARARALQPRRGDVEARPLAEALANYDQAIALFPDNAAAHTNRAADAEADGPARRGARRASSRRSRSIRTRSRRSSTAATSPTSRAGSTTPSPTTTARSRRSRSSPRRTTAGRSPR